MKKKSIALMLALGLVLTACGSETEVNKDITLMDEESSGLSYELVSVDRGEVVVTKDVVCIYDVTDIEEYSFKMDGETVSEVNVEKGDLVTKGQLLATLESEDTEGTIKEIKFNISRDELKLKQIDETKALLISQENEAFDSTDEQYDARVAHRENLENIEKTYASSIRTLEDELTILNLRLEEAEEYLEASRIYAGMDGVVSYVKVALEGSTTTDGENVIKIYDTASSKFICDDVSAGEYFDADETYTLVSGYGSARQEMLVQPVDMDSWTDEIYFSPIDEIPTLEINDKGHIYIVTDEAQNVLRLPSDCIHLSGEKPYVYVIDSDGVRRMKFIETGLVGDEYTEITGGLSEGDAVVS